MQVLSKAERVVASIGLFGSTGNLLVASAGQDGWHDAGPGFFELTHTVRVFHPHN